MNAPKDLTRWNRASLSRFRYINGNAVTYLETLRQALIDRFVDVEAKTLQWENLVPRQPNDPLDDDAFERLHREQARILNETERERLDRIIEQYEGERRDWGWEIARVLARSAHVLTEYIDAYANEGFLKTATQWNNVRRLVEMLDYHPAPPASAATLLVIEAKADASGTLNAGFQVKHAPADGGAPVVFETLADLDIDGDLNQLRPAEYDRSQDLAQGPLFVLDDEVEGLEIGEPLVLEDERTGALRGHRIIGLSVEEGATGIRVSPPVSPPLARGYVKVHLNPSDRLDPLGPVVRKAEVGGTLQLRSEPDGLELKKALYISDGFNGSYHRLVAIQGKQLQFATVIGPLLLDRAWVGPPVRLAVEYLFVIEDADGQWISSTFRAAGDWSYLTGHLTAKPARDLTVPLAEKPDEDLAVYLVAEAQYEPVATGIGADEGYTRLTLTRPKKDHNEDPPDRPTNENPLNRTTTLLLVPPAVTGPWQVDTSLQRDGTFLASPLTTSQPKKTGPGDLAMVDNGSHLAWARLGAVTVDEEGRTASLLAEEAWFEEEGGDFFLTETTILAHFKETVRLRDWQINDRPLTGTRIPLATVPAALVKGRTLIVENRDDPTVATAATIIAIDVLKSPVELVLSQGPPAGCTYGNTLIAANVVAAGHGEAKGEKVLGSGDATRLGQSFVLGATNVSFVADATQPAGVRAAIDVTVAGRTWEQVAGFQNSRPADAHYTVRMTEDGHLKITFGDGQRGRRLPTGSNNVRLTYRKGTGLDGNLDAGSFTKAAKPHHLVDKVHQPLPATGGNDMEGLESLRKNAPAALLTLERAVSLEDFDYLVMSQSSVWQAKAFARPTGLNRNQKIEVVVVPAGGGDLGTLAGTLTDFILAHSVPGLEVTVTAYRHQTFALEVLIAVDSAAYIPEEVVASVNSALEEAFSLKQRKLGQDVFLSEVYQVVETVTGVEHSQVVINGNGAIRRLPAGDRGVRTLGQLLVINQDGEAATTPATPSTATQAEPPPRLIGQGKAKMIQGIGTRHAYLLENSGIRTLEDLVRLDPLMPPADIPAVRLAEFKTKAELVLSLDVSKPLAAPLLDRSLFELLQANAADLARDSGQTLEACRQLQSQLRVLQIALDEVYLKTTTLHELLTERPPSEHES